MAHSPKVSIKQLTEDCLSSLENLAKNSYQPEDIKDWAQQQLWRLRLFADSLGALADGRSSVEHRLSFNPRAGVIISQLLQAVISNSKNCNVKFSSTIHYKN